MIRLILTVREMQWHEKATHEANASPRSARLTTPMLKDKSGVIVVKAMVEEDVAMPIKEAEVDLPHTLTEQCNNFRTLLYDDFPGLLQPMDSPLVTDNGIILLKQLTR
jgi:hypothetical protein